MKKFLLSLFSIMCVMNAHASNRADTAQTTLTQIIAVETEDQAKKKVNENLNATWGKNTFLNISYNKTKFSSDEFPSTAGRFPNEFKNELGAGLQWGHTFNFHRNPIGSVLFIGLDYTWMDVNFNKYKASAEPELYTPGEQVRNLPWHHEKMTLGYGMSLGPSLTLYPFTSATNGSEKIRLQLYYHVGYGVEGTMIKGVATKDGIEKKYAFGHGLFMSYGANLTWNFVGVGFEFRNDGNLKYKAVDDEFNTGKMKAKEKTSRLYLQFRF